MILAFIVFLFFVFFFYWLFVCIKYSNICVNKKNHSIKKVAKIYIYKKDKLLK